MGYFVIHPDDTVKICLENGQKYARRSIQKGESVIKYGYPIGQASMNIAKNELVCYNIEKGSEGVSKLCLQIIHTREKICSSSTR